MNEKNKILNGFLTGLFSGLTRVEELALSKSFPDLSIKEIHLIDAVCTAGEEGEDPASTALAWKLRITPGSLTVAVATLEKKGYITRNRDERDKRIVRLRATERGQAVYREHTEFHDRMIDHVADDLTGEEISALERAVNQVTDFFKKQAEKIKASQDNDKEE